MEVLNFMQYIVKKSVKLTVISAFLYNKFYVYTITIFNNSGNHFSRTKMIRFLKILNHKLIVYVIKFFEYLKYKF